jgi:radical SAM protein with 4Fe4S-binding SPASM domain
VAHVRKQQIAFFVTTKCNLNCMYCYTLKASRVKKEHEHIDFCFARRGIDDFFRDYPSRQIRFYGVGEPTQEFELVKEIRDYAYSKAGHALTVELQTNGVFSDRIAEWIVNHVDILWISCDGPSEVQNAQRPTVGGGPTSDLVEHNLRFFVHEAERRKMQVGCRVTVIPSMMHRQSEIVTYFNQLGIRYVNAHPACTPAEGELAKTLTYNPLEFAQGFLVAHNKGKELGLFYNSLFTANFDEQTRHACRALVPYPHLTSDGYVSCCDFAQFGPEYDPGPLQQLIYGKYIPEEDRIVYDEKKIHAIRSRCAEELEKGICQGCAYVHHCAGGCVGQVVNETGDLMGMHEVNCAITRYLAERMPLNQGLYPVLHS